MSIRNVGRVYQCFINEPTDAFPTCGVKVAFFTRAAADVFWNKTRVIGHRIGNHRGVVVRNNFRVKELTTPGLSRVLVLTGPAGLVRQGDIFRLLRDNIKFFGTEEVYSENLAVGNKLLRIYFVSFRGQAESACAILHKTFGKSVKLSWAEDPCGKL